MEIIIGIAWLMIKMEIQHGIQPPVENLVDVCNIPELNALEIRGDELFIGAAVPLSDIISSPLVKENGQALVEACKLIGGPQVRNTATLGGNVAHALPAADGTIALLALNSQVEAVGKNGTRNSDLEEIFIGPRRSTIGESHELLVGFNCPLRSDGQASAFRRVMRSQGVALPVLNIAIWIHRDEKRILDSRLAIGTSGPVPMRMRQAEEVMRGEIIKPALVDIVYETILDELLLRTNPYRSAADYRSLMAKVLLQEVLEIAWRRAGG